MEDISDFCNFKEFEILKQHALGPFRLYAETIFVPMFCPPQLTTCIYVVPHKRICISACVFVLYRIYVRNFNSFPSSYTLTDVLHLSLSGIYNLPDRKCLEVLKPVEYQLCHTCEITVYEHASVFIQVYLANILCYN